MTLFKMICGQTYFVYGQFIGIPLWYPFNAEINNGHSNVWTFQCDNATRRATNISGSDATNFWNDHLSITALGFSSLFFLQSFFALPSMIPVIVCRFTLYLQWQIFLHSIETTFEQYQKERKWNHCYVNSNMNIARLEKCEKIGY